MSSHKSKQFPYLSPESEMRRFGGVIFTRPGMNKSMPDRSGSGGEPTAVEIKLPHSRRALEIERRQTTVRFLFARQDRHASFMHLDSFPAARV